MPRLTFRHRCPECGCQMLEKQQPTWWMLLFRACRCYRCYECEQLILKMG